MKEKICDCNKVEKTVNNYSSASPQNIFFSLSKTCLINVGGFLNGIGEHTLGESLINLRTIGRLSAKVQTSRIMRQFILVRNHTNIMSGKDFNQCSHLIHIGEIPYKCSM